MPVTGEWRERLSDRAMAAGLRRGSRRAWERFDATYSVPLYRFVLSRTRDPQMAEDIAQDAIVACIEGIGRYQPSRGSLWNWLCGITANKVREQRRRNERQERTIEHLQSLPALPDPTEDGIAEDKIFPILAALHPRHQEVLTLKYLEGQDVATVAARLGCSIKAAESRLTRARDAFRREHNRQCKEMDCG